MSHQNNTGGITAIIVTIVVVGGLVYLGVSNKDTAAGSPAATAASSMAGHHGGAASGPAAKLNDLVGTLAPDFSLSDREGKTYSLAALKGKNVILFFNEGMMCYPACWNQIAALGKDARLQNENTVVLSVVVDSASEWKSAVTKMPELAQATVVHDNGASVSRAYDMLTTKSSMHYGQLPGHTYIVIDTEGVIQHVYDDPAMAIHNEQLVAEVAKLAS